MTQLNKTNQEQLEAEKKKVISITIQASNNKVKDKRKKVVQKEKNIEEPIKQISKEKVVTKVSKKASRKRIEAPCKEVMKKKKRKVKETEEEEEVGYIVEKLVNDRQRKHIWEIEVKWKDHDETTWEPMKNIKADTPEMVEEYMNEMSKKKAAKNKKKKRKPKGVKKLVCRLQHDRKSSFKMEKDIRVFTANGKKNMMECEDCDSLLMPSKKEPVYLCKDPTCDLGVCWKCHYIFYK